MAHAPSLNPTPTHKDPMTTRPSPIAVSPDGNLKIYPKGTSIFPFLDKPATVQDAVAIFEFEGVPFRSVTLDGRRLVPASEQGRALGYQDGRHYVNSIREWMEQGELRPDEHVVRIEGEALKRVKELSADPALSRAPSLIMLTEQGVIRAALLAGGPKALRFRDYATGVMFNVLTTGAHVERGATGEPKPLPSVAQGLIPIDKSREIRLYSASMKRAGRPIEEIANYQRREESALGLGFLGRGMPSSIHTQPAQVPLLPAPTLAARAVPFEALRTWATGREPFTTQEALASVLGVPETGIRQPAVQWFNAALRQIGCLQTRVRGQRRRWVLGA